MLHVARLAATGNPGREILRFARLPGKNVQRPRRMTPSPVRDLTAFKEAYERDGYFVVPALFSPSEVAEIIAEFEAIHTAGDAERIYSDKITDPNDPLTHWPRVVHPHRFNAVARRYLLHPEIRALLTATLGAEPVAAQTMYYFKPPGSRGQAMHQDNLYLLVQPGTCVGVWTAMDVCDEQNGCMMVVPGSHRGNLLCNENAHLGESFAPGFVRIPKGMKAVPVRLQPGDSLVFHGQLIHGSGPNRHPTRFRRSFIGHYAAGNVQQISQFYLPLVKFADSADYEVTAVTDGGACGETWQGAAH
ncbi:phytanoyl-CoA dioxygenase family protein [Horticoccus luteus]|uniref:Phytanoyl-CoA dioxygenase family protein n=1 Tax=Horticoccus luteus TaxID=2862869 RepID=A0A8F9TW91_9BACT|nr:phytanoyl-CoA dioxygenase family protein [Horticoccus luteus]QYM79161.1 phytanoyl-CoA dioxygenase family protein [Horticoccus luteus]